MLFAGIGPEGQARLAGSSAVIVGCGAIGAAVANLLVRAGVGRIRILDRDFVEPSNLQRQILFDEADAREALPKAVAAERKLRALNSDVQIEGVVADLNSRNAQELLSGFPPDTGLARTILKRVSWSNDLPSNQALLGFMPPRLPAMA